MLTMVERSGGIGVMRCGHHWNGELQKIAKRLIGHFIDCNDSGFHPHADEIAIQRELLALPVLAQLADAIRRSQARGLAITDLGLRGMDATSRNAVLYAIALCLGFPTSTDQRTRRVAWDVRARQLPPGSDTRFVTFSERTGSADMHTDSSFYPMPEEQFFLYVVNAARCKGGASLLIDVDDIAHQLQGSLAGREAFELLSNTLLPFRVPAVYASGDDQLEFFMAPVFQRRGGEDGADGADGTLSMRWRYDAILKGLAARREYGNPAIFAALELVNQLIEHGAPRFQRHLPDDTLLWADNHRTLHGRADYLDPERHLIRIRISSVPNALRIGPSGIGAD